MLPMLKSTKCGFPPVKWFGKGVRSASFPAKPSESITVPKEEVHKFCVNCMQAVDTPLESATDLADVLTAADYRGHFSHGLSRLGVYVKEIQTDSLDKNAKPSVVTETSAIAVVDGNNGVGASTGRFSMGLAMKKAKEVGIGFVTARGCNHYGIAGWYSTMALEKGFIGLSFTNTSPVMVPTRAMKKLLGTNPISVAAPGLGTDSFVLDMATSAVAFGKIEVARRKQVQVPDNWGVDSGGQVTNDPNEVTGLLPLGGIESHSSFKGSGLAMMVEVLTAMLSGANYGPNIRNWLDFNDNANLGQCFIAINPDLFVPGFRDRLSDLMSLIRKTESQCMKPVLVAGDPEKLHQRMVDEEGGIAYLASEIDKCDTLAEELAVPKILRKL